MQAADGCPSVSARYWLVDRYSSPGWVSGMLEVGREAAGAGGEQQEVGTNWRRHTAASGPPGADLEEITVHLNTCHTTLFLLI